jgi:hypothetical protein
VPAAVAKLGSSSSWQIKAAAPPSSSSAPLAVAVLPAVARNLSLKHFDFATEEDLLVASPCPAYTCPRSLVSVCTAHKDFLVVLNTTRPRLAFFLFELLRVCARTRPAWWTAPQATAGRCPFMRLLNGPSRCRPWATPPTWPGKVGIARVRSRFFFFFAGLCVRGVFVSGCVRLRAFLRVSSSLRLQVCGVGRLGGPGPAPPR